MDKNDTPVLLYVAEDGRTEIEVSLEGETVWLSQVQMARLFQKDVRTVSEHIRNVYEEGELEKDPTIRNFRRVQKEGGRAVSRDIEYYNLDVIISVGYRVHSHRGTQFRIWATGKLREYIVKGFVIDIVAVLTEQLDYNRVKTYWTTLKNRLKHEGSELVTNCDQLKMLAQDGKMRKTDVKTMLCLPIT